MAKISFKVDEVDTAQERRNAHYAEDNVTEEHERLGAQYVDPEPEETSTQED